MHTPPAKLSLSLLIKLYPSILILWSVYELSNHVSEIEKTAILYFLAINLSSDTL